MRSLQLQEKTHREFNDQTRICHFWKKDAEIKLLTFPGSVKILTSVLVLYDYCFIQNM